MSVAGLEARPVPSTSDVARMMRATLASTEFRTEGHRKAALRRLLHESVAGLDAKGLFRFVEDLKSRFPDRIFEAISKVRHLETRLHAVEAETVALRAEVETLRARARSGEALLSRLYEKATSGGDRPPGAGGSIAALPVEPRAQDRFVQLLQDLVTFALDQDTTTTTVEESLGRGQAARRDVTLAELVSRYSRGEGRPGDDQMEIEKRLKRMRLLPAALLAGIQQSWKGGTREVLEYLDPKSAEAAVPARFPGLREAAVLKEVRKRYEQFWDDLDKNITHYYRGTFEKVYSEKMEGRS
jgi:hypothetical protein